MRFVIIIYILVFVISAGMINQQPDLTRGKNVVQFNYDWNKNNTYKWSSTVNANYYYMSLDKFPEMKSKMKIKTVPTIIVIENGKEVKRYEANLSTMQISIPQAEIIK